MAIQFQSNLASLSAQRVMFQNIRSQSDVLQQLSTGLRINSADDDAAGLAISERLNSQIRGNKKASENIQDAYNMLSTVDGFLSQVGNILQRQKELAVQAGNDTNSDEQLLALQSEFNQNADEIERMGETFKYNGMLTYQRTQSFASLSRFNIQVGNSAGLNNFLDISDVINLAGGGSYTNDSGLVKFLNGEPNGSISRGTHGKFSDGSSYISIKYVPGYDSLATNYFGFSHDSMTTLLTELDNAQGLLNGLRGRVGAHLNRFEAALNNLNIQIENQTAAMARYTNTDFAKASIDFTRTQILQQSAAAVLTQANQNQNIALQLIQN